MITANQIRAARALLGWSQTRLARAANISRATVENVERGVVDPLSSTLEKIQIALKSADIEIISGEQNSPDVGLPGVVVGRRPKSR